MRRLVSCHHLASVGKNSGGEQAEGVDTWEQNVNEEDFDTGGNKCFFCSTDTGEKQIKSLRLISKHASGP